MFWSNKTTESTFLYKNLLNQRMLGLKIPICIIWESRIRITDSIMLGLGIEKQQDEEFIFKLGSRYQMQEFLTLLISYQQEPARLGAGIIFELQSFKLAYGIRTHQYLPYTHTISVTYELP
ncbi:hypothetical protein ACFLYK_04885 [Candidatus Cloacimonadota bacterium]